MKILRFSFRKIIFIAALFMAISADVAARAQDLKSFDASVTRIHGEARFSTDDKNWHQLHTGQQLKAGATIQTATSSTVDLVFRPARGEAKPSNSQNIQSSVKQIGKSGVLRLYPTSVVKIDSLKIAQHWSWKQVATIRDNQEVHLDLKTGQITVIFPVTQSIGTNQVTFFGGNAVMGAGTYILSTTGVVYSLNGTVQITNSESHSVQTLSSGFYRDLGGRILSIPPMTVCLPHYLSEPLLDQ